MLSSNSIIKLRYLWLRRFSKQCCIFTPYTRQLNVLIIYRFLKNKCTNQYLLTHNHQHWKLWISGDSLELRESQSTWSISTFEILMRFVVTNSIYLHWFSVYQNCPHFYAVNNPGCLEKSSENIPSVNRCSKKDIILILN